jgi:hypothetical protein
MSEIETCIVRPELIEFKKSGTNYHTIVAADDGFKFMTTGTATNESNPENLTFDVAGPDGVGGNLANVWMDSLYVRSFNLGGGVDAVLPGQGSTFTNVETITMTKNIQGNIFVMNGFISNVERFYDLEHIVMRTNDNAHIDMSNGNITQIKHMAFMPDATVDANSAAMSNLDTLVFGDNDGSVNGVMSKVSNLATLDMVATSNARINMAEGHLEMAGSDAVANIGDLVVFHNIIRRERSDNDPSTASVQIEETNIVNSTMYLSNIAGTYTGVGGVVNAPVRVVDAVFTYSGRPDPRGENRDPQYGIMTVGKIQTNIIEPEANLQDDGNDNDLILRARGNDGVIMLQRVGNNNPVRIQNLAEPVENSDAVNKAYVQNIMDRNIQGLKPKEACDTTLFAPGYANTNSNISSDTDAIFGPSVSWSMSMTPQSDGDVDTSDLYLYIPAETGENVTIGGVTYTQSMLNAANLAEMSSEAGTDPIQPTQRKTRVLFNGFMNGSNPTFITPLTPEGTDVIELNTISGINGIWEINEVATQQTGGSGLLSTYTKIRFRRAADMNQSHEAMNGSYVYIKGDATQQHKNKAFVIQAPNDPIGISMTSGLTVKDGTSPEEVVELKWVTFNTVNYELDFVDTIGRTKEFIEESVRFRKGGIAMKYEAGDDKKVMVDSQMLRYDVQSLELHINGNITFNELSDGKDVYIQHNGNIIQNTPDLTQHILINGSKLYMGDANVDGNGEPNDGDPLVPMIDTYQVNCTNVTCASDNRLKKNITPLTNALDLVSKLHAVTYNWNTSPDGATPEYGFVAQQIEENFPTLVTTNTSTGYKAVDYMKITSILAGAIQELAAKLSA